MSEKLREILNKGRNWERWPTTIPGVFVVKIPGGRGGGRGRGRLPSMGVEVNPLDESGRTTKRRSLLLRSLIELNVFREVLGDRRLEKLVAMVEKVNPVPAGTYPRYWSGYRALCRVLESVKWRRYPKRVIEWCFLEEAPSELVALLEQRKGECSIGGYVYRVKELVEGKVIITRRRIPIKK